MGKEKSVLWQPAESFHFKRSCKNYRSKHSYVSGLHLKKQLLRGTIAKFQVHLEIVSAAGDSGLI